MPAKDVLHVPVSSDECSTETRGFYVQRTIAIHFSPILYCTCTAQVHVEIRRNAKCQMPDASVQAIVLIVAGRYLVQLQVLYDHRYCNFFGLIASEETCDVNMFFQ